MHEAAVRRRALACSALALGLLGMDLAPAGSAPPPPEVAPPGTAVLIPDAAWSWFEDRRATFDSAGTTLYASAVAGISSTAERPGSVLALELDLETGRRGIASLGVGQPDDHNSASIWVAPDGEVATSWSLHHQNAQLRMGRRRTDGTWLTLPGLSVTSKSTYSNLIGAAQQDGTSLLYDFFRGERFDPEVIASADVGRTWSSIGRVLRDPQDSVTTRPYVQYRSTSPSRIDLIATEAHPDAEQTSIYHGYIEDGLLHRSDGTVLGPLGSAVPVTALTAVWEPTDTERGWTADLVADPHTGALTVAFSVAVSAADHRYWTARWTGSAWAATEVAFAGSALYDLQPNYTGLIALDPQDPEHLVLSADVHPATGVPLPVSADGERHWELWDGHRQGNGTVTWTPLTSGSLADNLRPVFASHPGGADALLWMRGQYTSYASYDLDIVGVVRRSDHGTVAPAETADRLPVRAVIAAPPPLAAAARPVVGRLDGDDADDLLLHRPGAAREDLLLGDQRRHPTPVAAPTVQGTYTPIPGDYDANGTTDIYWYAPGTATDQLWTTNPDGTYTPTTPRQVKGTYTPIPGDYDANGTTDIYWYAPGTATDQRWWSVTAPFSDTEAAPINL